MIFPDLGELNENKEGMCMKALSDYNKAIQVDPSGSIMIIINFYIDG